MGKLDPTAYDRWWRSRINKEETTYGVKEGQSTNPITHTSTQPGTVFLNTLGTGQIRPGTALRAPMADDARSMASEARGPPAEVGHSVASYPRTPQYSQAGTNSKTELAQRLEGLEDALAEERVKRLQAEEEMRQLAVLTRQRKGKK
ncbi:hypothetical protein TSOC_006848 [Tetrabaena socialis]|uniref:Uncharacterized protein n=1 Tax=Tetrabaena socialis TaxID=47790 RepID=A0A2J8A2M3_9CHLO|nr:hypothetical protein TSOC_006848 [Tetrabaena socialis]|eukprot:PNH06765.1 hypothetical protein TSOC_006848 [Tetrabaena socialis]